MTDPPPREARKAFTAALTEFEGQREWYDNRASSFKTRAQRFDMLIIAAGALVAALPPFREVLGNRLDYILAALGITIVIAQGVQRVFRYSEIWPEYRLACERMNREWRLFINGAAPYDGEDREAQALYIAALDAIMAEEQKIFIDTRRANANDGETP